MMVRASKKKTNRKNRHGLMRLMALWLAVCLVCTSAVTARAEEGQTVAESFESVDISAMVYQEGGWGIPAEEALIQAYGLNDELESLKAAILGAMQKNEASLDVSSYGLTTGDGDALSQLVAAVINEHPELFYVGYNGFTYFPNGSISQLRFTYSYTQEQREAFAQKLEQAAGLVTPDMTDAEKALALHDYLAQNCAYAYQEYRDNTLYDHMDFFTAYGALVEGRAVCQGYALAYNAMLRKVGIDSIYCSSREMNHGWSLVEIDGEWYHVDVTWDDPVWNLEGRVLHKNFLLSDDGIQSQEHKGWTSEVSCTSESYDEYWWQNVNSRILVAGQGLYYYIAPADSGRGFQLLQRTGDTVETKYSNNAVWNAWGSNGYYTNPYAYLSRRGDMLFFNDKLNLYAMGLSDFEPQTVYTYDKADGYIYGAMVYGDGTVRLSIDTSPNRENDGYITVDLNGLFVSGITLDQSAHTMKAGETFTLTAEVTPASATNRKVSWTSSDDTVAAVGADGTVTAKKAGTAVITATTEDGGKTASCEVTVSCEHQMAEWKTAKEPDCTEAGIQSRKCLNCDYTENKEISALGHSWEEIVDAPATEEQAGRKHQECSVCHAKGQETVIPQLDHTHSMVHHEGVPATCTQAGQKAYYECTKCHKFYSDVTGNLEIADPAIGKLGHSFAEYVFDEGSADCTTDGTETAVCGRCGEKDTRTAEGTKLGHRLSGWETSKEPNCTEAGIQNRKCLNCDYTESKEISALGHRFGEWTRDKEPTCTKKGSEIRTCSACGETESRDVEAIGHKWKTAMNWAEDYSGAEAIATCENDPTHVEKLAGVVVTKKDTSTCEEDGVITYTGTVSLPDGNIFTDVKTEQGTKFGHSFSHYILNSDKTSATAKCDRDNCDKTDTKESWITITDKTEQKELIDVGGLDLNRIVPEPAGRQIEVVLCQEKAAQADAEALKAKVGGNYEDIEVFAFRMLLSVDGGESTEITDDFGSIRLSLPAGRSHAGKNAIVYQLHGEEIIEHKNLKVDAEGNVGLKVEKFSSFLIAVEKEMPVQKPTQQAPAARPGGFLEAMDVDWNTVVGSVNGAQPGENINILTGESFTVPAYVIDALIGKNTTLAMQLGNGTAISLSGGNIKKPQGAFALSLSGALEIPEAVKNEQAFGTAYREFSIENTGTFPYHANLHVALGAENAGKTAYLYRYDAKTQSLQTAGSFRITKTGQAMFSMVQGGRYLVTVSSGAEKDAGTYTVVKGDCLSRIAAKYRISLKALLMENQQIKDIHRIYPGQEIQIPER